MRFAAVLLTIALVANAGRAADDAASPGPKRVAVFTPHGAGDSFWTLFTGFMDAAAADLDLVIEVHHAEDSRETMGEQIARACTTAPRADAVVFQSLKQAGRRYLEEAEAHGVPAVLVNAGLVEPDAGALGAPRTVLRSWIGEMLPDDYGAGYLLAEALVARAKRDPTRVDGTGRVHMVALSGVVSDTASIERVRGLHAALDERDDVVLHQVVGARWREDAAAFRTRILLQRYPKTTVVWAANDPMALGAITAIEQTGRVPGRDVLVGGVDWTAAALDAIDAGTLECTVGGHFMEGGWVAVLLHDYFAGRDFADDRVRFRSPMSVIDRDNVSRMRPLVDPASWARIDFRTLSRQANPDRTHYVFGPEVVADDVASPTTEPEPEPAP